MTSGVTWMTYRYLSRRTEFDDSSSGFKQLTGMDSETEVVEFKEGNDQVVRKHPGTSCTASGGLVCTDIGAEAEALVISVKVDFTP